MRILYLGENWYGSCARACSYALRRLGHEVADIDMQTIYPSLRQLSSRLMLRLFRGQLLDEYNQQVIDLANSFNPECLLAFKGQYLRSDTLRYLRQRGVKLYNYFPDRIELYRGTLIEEAFPEYDCIFETKEYWDGDASGQIKIRDKVFVPHGYDADVHRPTALTEFDKVQYSCDVGYIATYTLRKELIISELIEKYPNVDLKIWGSGWKKSCRDKRLIKYVRENDLRGMSYAKAIQATKINLGIMGILPNIVDETSTRTYEIPACMGFLLHERTNEVLNLYEEGCEIACFDTTDELIENIRRYLSDDDRRLQIARAGFNRCVPAYSYDNRMAEIIKYHLAHN